jgi:hypothetical protein
MTATEKTKKYQPLDDQFLHSAAIIDANGREVAITAEMIDQACDKLALQFEQFQQPESKRG